jgi:hypothetical protein
MDGVGLCLENRWPRKGVWVRSLHYPPHMIGRPNRAASDKVVDMVGESPAPIIITYASLLIGRKTDSESVNLGSNPSRRAIHGPLAQRLVQLPLKQKGLSSSLRGLSIHSPCRLMAGLHPLKVGTGGQYPVG